MSDTKLLAKDLRIGNLVYGPLNELCVVDQIGRYDNPEYVAYHELNNLVSGGQNGQRPIPLSEDVLVKLGFRIDKKARTCEFYNGEKDIELIYFEGKIYEEIEGQWRSLEHIKYVNQLMNLYHSLTGEELIYTEN